MMLTALRLVATIVAGANAQGIYYIDNRAEPLRHAQLTNLIYYGGPILTSPQVFSIFYGSDLYQAEINQMYSDVVQSPYMDWLDEYYTPNYGVVGRGNFIGTYLETENIKTTLNDYTYIQPYLRSLVMKKVITPGPNTYFPIHIPMNTAVYLGSDSLCGTFCAYHSTIDISDISSEKYLYYGVIGDMGSSGCNTGCGDAPTALRNIFSVATHELIEAATDPAVGAAPYLQSPIAWYDPMNGEIGDMCNAVHYELVLPNGTYTVQKQWSNLEKACIALGSPTRTVKTTYSVTKTSTKTSIISTLSTYITSTSSSSTSASSTDIYSPSMITTGIPTPTPLVCHDVCQIGTPMQSDCGWAAYCVIKTLNDTFCQTSFWDSICVNEAIGCGAICGSTATTTYTLLFSSKSDVQTATSTYTPVTPTNTPDCHSECEVGFPLALGCSSVAKCVGEMDSYCYKNAWDALCVNEAKEKCNAQCGLQYTTSTTTTTIPTGYPSYCHDVCQIGDALHYDCGSIATCVLQSWDELCVAQAIYSCGAVCPGANATQASFCHSDCSVGWRLPPMCATSHSSCTTSIDPFCGNNEYDEICVAGASTFCGAACTNLTTPALSYCHNPCETGERIPNWCNTLYSVYPCVAAINADCQLKKWDSNCVNIAVSSCNAACPPKGYLTSSATTFKTSSTYKSSSSNSLYKSSSSSFISSSKSYSSTSTLKSTTSINTYKSSSPSSTSTYKSISTSPYKSSLPSTTYKPPTSTSPYKSSSSSTSTNNSSSTSTYKSSSSSGTDKPIPSSSVYKSSSSTSTYKPATSTSTYKSSSTTSTYKSSSSTSTYKPATSTSTYKSSSTAITYKSSSSTSTYKPATSTSTFKSSSTTSTYKSSSSTSTYKPAALTSTYKSSLTTTIYKSSSSSTTKLSSTDTANTYKSTSSTISTYKSPSLTSIYKPLTSLKSTSMSTNDDK